jgi:hypothetical protein
MSVAWRVQAHDDGNQDVDGHERPTSIFIIRISDGINFIISNG